MENLLIVDDDPAIREIFTIILQQHGYAVRSAASAHECLAALARMTPDLIMLDIMMYPVDGWETLTAIRKNPRTTGIPVIMFSGKSPSREEIYPYGEWIEDYLMKPLSMQVISSSLKEALERVHTGRTEREQFLQNGGDPAVIEEYQSLKRFFHICHRFFREMQQGSDDSRSLPHTRKIRFEDLGRVVSSLTCLQEGRARGLPGM